MVTSALTGLFLQTGVELVDWWRDLQAGLKNSLLPLQTDVLGPFNKSAQITLRLNALTNFKVARSSDEKWVLDFLDFGFFHS